MVEPRVYRAMAQPVVGHLDPYFFTVVDEIRAGLRTVFGTQNPMTYAISGTGSAGMETAVANFVEPGMKVAVFANGFFCDRITEMAKRHGGAVVRLERPWGQSFDAGEAAEFVAREKPQVVAYVQAETSSGVYTPGKDICAAARAVDALVIADTVTSLGAMPVEVDKNGIDVAYSCTQKGLSCPPGLAPITVSPRAVERLRARKTPVSSWYLDLRLLEEYYDGPHKYHHTAPVSLFYGLREGLAAIAEEGLEDRWERHRRNHLALVEGFAAMGLEMLVGEPNRIWNLNTPLVPKGVDDVAVRKRLMEAHGMEVLGGFGPLAGRVLRVGLMGPLATPEGTSALLSALEGALAAEGYRGRATAKV
jgi:alanine-glyoxylate transaminase/serine-glyoxylate transaminase/serine-pyruvate transaminase